MIAEVLAAAALAIGPAALLDAPDTQSLAVAGDDVVVVRAADRGRARVDAVAVQGGAVRHLLATRRLDPGWTAYVFADASAQRVAVLALIEKHVDHGPDVVRARLYSGPPGRPLQLDVTAGGRNWRETWLPVALAVDGDRVLVSELRDAGDRSRLRLWAGGAAPRLLRWARNRVFSRFAFAGENVAFTRRDRLVVADLHTGARRLPASRPPARVRASRSMSASSTGHCAAAGCARS